MQVRKIFNKIILNSTDWDLLQFETIKAKQIKKELNKEKTSDSLAFRNVMNYLFGIEPMAQKKIVENCAKASLEDIKKIAKAYLPMLLSADKSQTTILCDSDFVSKTVRDFKQFGISLKTYDDKEEIFS